MKTIAELCQQIESADFIAEINVASGLRTFENGVSLLAPSKELASQMQDAEVRNQVARRAHELATAPLSADEDLPVDTPLAVYLLLLSQHDERLAVDIITASNVDRPWWWARQVARRILAASERVENRAVRKDSA